MPKRPRRIMKKKPVKSKQVGGKLTFKKVGSAINKGVKFAQKSKIISKTAGLAALAGVPNAGRVAEIARTVGFGCQCGNGPINPARSIRQRKIGFNVIV